MTAEQEPRAGAPERPPPPAIARQRQSLPRAIADTLKDWIAERGLKPGDRLPQERELVAMFAASKSTVREALKILEAQGLVKTRTGPGGGAFIAPVSERDAAELLGNYFFFAEPTIGDIYALRILLEPEAAASVAGRLTEADYERLTDRMRVSAHPPATVEEERRQRVAELEFHEVLVGYCPNPLLAFGCRFLISLLKNLAICRRIYARPNPELREQGHSYQLRLVEALKAGDAEAAREVMRAHMIGARDIMEAQEAMVMRQFLRMDRSAQPPKG